MQRTKPLKFQEQIFMKNWSFTVKMALSKPQKTFEVVSIMKIFFQVEIISTIPQCHAKTNFGMSFPSLIACGIVNKTEQIILFRHIYDILY